MEADSKKLANIEENPNAKCLYCDSELCYRVDYAMEGETYRVYLCEKCDKDEIESFERE